MFGGRHAEQAFDELVHAAATLFDACQHSGGIVTEFAGQRIVREPVPVDRDEPLKRELADFVACARAGAEPKVGGREATAALELALEITRQIGVAKT